MIPCNFSGNTAGIIKRFSEKIIKILSALVKTTTHLVSLARTAIYLLILATPRSSSKLITCPMGLYR